MGAMDPCQSIRIRVVRIRSTEEFDPSAVYPETRNAEDWVGHLIVFNPHQR